MLICAREMATAVAQIEVSQYVSDTEQKQPTLIVPSVQHASHNNTFDPRASSNQNNQRQEKSARENQQKSIYIYTRCIEIREARHKCLAWL